MKKVIIGLISKHNNANTSRADTFIRDEMKNAIFDNNAIAIGILPPNKDITLVDKNNEYNIFKTLDILFSDKETQDFIAQIQLCDGIILSGGGESDAYEMWVSKYCYDNNIPILGICAGHNNLIRGIGGKTKKVSNPEFHNQPNKDYVHGITIEKNSNFYNFVKKEKLNVNSRHKNTIECPASLDVVAYDEDGNIEVTEAKNKICFIGMRFHPESLYMNDLIHNNIFKKFIEICKTNSKRL
ncbi:MAG: gamma-glutamyl-gamma-aminobutyrate hydrolase family protein [Clostridia bacterium]|nr:gamma-glutamyl-gamma-aminobutyrate hydrolase family protein [Clostridia bacterium]